MLQLLNSRFVSLNNYILQTNHGATATKQQIAELKELRDALVANFREQMSLRHRLMEIGKTLKINILSLSMFR